MEGSGKRLPLILHTTANTDSTTDSDSDTHTTADIFNDTTTTSSPDAIKNTLSLTLSLSHNSL